MKIFGSGDDVGIENLNSLHACDAVVDSGATGTTGSVYTTVANAMSAGKKAIVVMPGSYSGFTVTQAGTTIIGVVRPQITGTTIAAGAAEFNSQIQVNAPYVTLKQLGSDNSSHAFDFDASADYCILDSCCAASPNNSGVQFGGGYSGITISNCTFVDCGNGILIAVSSAGDNLHGIRVINNNILGSAGNGIAVMNLSGVDTSNYRSPLIMGNLIDSNAIGWGSGITIETDTGAQIIGNTITNQGTASVDSHGIDIGVIGATPYNRVIVAHNVISANYGYGISHSSATQSYQERISIVGNVVVNNGSGELQNCNYCKGHYTLTTNVIG
jgi:Right handed beta helix region